MKSLLCNLPQWCLMIWKVSSPTLSLISRLALVGICPQSEAITDLHGAVIHVQQLTRLFPVLKAVKAYRLLMMQVRNGTLSCADWDNSPPAIHLLLELVLLKKSC